MARIFITGSADGLGQMAAAALIQQGHQVILHARNGQRAKQALDKTPDAETALAADLSNAEETKQLAAQINDLGHFDAIIHNAGVYQVPNITILAVNTIAPYILTCLIKPPKRLIYLSSGMHLSGDPTLKGLQQNPPQASYSDSKLHDLLLAKAIARKYPEVYANAIDPGWVATKMGGAGAPDNLQKGYQTQIWLATAEDPNAKVSGQYFHHQRTARYHTQADDINIQEQFLDLCAKISGVKLAT